MLSVNQCMKYFKKGTFTEEEMEEIRDSLYQLANIIMDDRDLMEKAKKFSSQGETK